VLVEGELGTGTAVALAGVALALTTTACFAAPLHRRLARGRDAALVARLRVADRVRTVGALCALLGVVLSAV
jgi:hypothetical protein